MKELIYLKFYCEIKRVKYIFFISLRNNIYNFFRTEF